MRICALAWIVSNVTAFDVIGDLHGCCGKLRGLLSLLGYQERGGAFRHASHTAVFVGDLIDRGPEQLETVRTVRAMVDAGSAVALMGNHEFNALAYATSDPDTAGSFMRPHIAKNLRQHKRFLQEVGEGSALHLEILGWFATLPLWLDLNGLNVAHACWHEPSIELLDAQLPVGEFDTASIVEANRRGSAMFEACEVVLKGPEVSLGDRVFVDKDDQNRSTARLRWWDPSAVTLRDAAEIPSGAETPTGAPFPPLPEDPCPKMQEFAYRNRTPVAFGHYWRTGKVRVEGTNAVCVDFSAVKGGPLVAYRWDGEPELSDSNLVAFA
jgi:hypothetical protein